MKRLTALLILCMLLGLDAYAGPPTIINSGSAGILTDSNCDQAKYYSIGTLCQDTDDKKLYKGIGNGVEEIAAASLTAASTAEVAAGTVENKYVNPKELKTVTDGKAPNILTGYTSGAGTVAATDTVLQAIQKLNGNLDQSISAGSDGTYGVSVKNNTSTFAPVGGDYNYGFASVNSLPKYYNGTTLLGLVTEGTATGGLLLGDGIPDAAGEVGYDSGKFSFYGANSEDIYIEPGNAANSAVLASNTGVLKMTFSGISLDASVPVYLSTDATVTVAGSSAIYLNADDDVIAFNLPASPIDGSGNGKAFCFRNLYARAMTINPDDSDYIQKGATKAAQGEAIVSTGAADELMCLIGIDASNWVSMGQIGTWAEESP